MSYLHSTCNYIWSKDGKKCCLLHILRRMANGTKKFTFDRFTGAVNVRKEGKVYCLKGWIYRDGKYDICFALIVFCTVKITQNSCLPLICTGNEILNLLLFHTSTTKYVHENQGTRTFATNPCCRKEMQKYTFKPIFSIGIKCFKVSVALKLAEINVY